MAGNARYSRHLLLHELGAAGQARIRSGRVLVIGTGGLGGPALLYLAAAGVGTLGIADADTVDFSNLQRQIIHATPDVGSPKIESAARKIEALNPEVKVVLHDGFVTPDTAVGLVRQYDFVLDATDNFAAKFLINDACVISGTPFSHAGVIAFRGQTMTVHPGKTACYRCVFESEPDDGVVETSAEIGILGTVAGIFGTLQATEALKHLSGAGTPLVNALLMMDALPMTFRKIAVAQRMGCPTCQRAFSAA